MAASALARRRYFFALQATIALAAGIALGWMVVREVEWAMAQAALRRASLRLVALAFAMVLAAGLLRGLRWKLLFLEERVGFLRLFFVENTGLGVNNISPLRFIGEPVQFGLLTLRDRLSGGTVLATVATKHTFELVCQVVMLGTALVLLPAMKPFAAYIITAVGFSILALVALFFIAPLMRRLPGLARVGAAHDFSRGVALMRRHKLRVVGAFLLTGGYFLLTGAAGWLVAHSTGLDLSLPATLVITMATLFFASAVPGLPGALGTFEFAAVFLLKLFGVNQSAAFGFAILLHLVLFLPPSLIAALVLPREGVKSMAQLREFIQQARRSREEEEAAAAAEALVVAPRRPASRP